MKNRSLSARRAWIEIAVQELIPLADPASLSARRAWIEIGSGDYVQYNYNVALRKESVDRNRQCRNSQNINRGRSPQGERG